MARTRKTTTTTPQPTKNFFTTGTLLSEGGTVVRAYPRIAVVPTSHRFRDDERRPRMGTPSPRTPRWQGSTEQVGDRLALLLQLVDALAEGRAPEVVDLQALDDL